MAFFLSSAAVLYSDSFPRFLSAPQKTSGRNPSSWIKATASTEPDKEKISNGNGLSEQKASSEPPLRPKKLEYSMKKGQIVRVDKEKYLNSINYLSVGHPPYYKGLDYIYEDRGEIAWVGIPTAPAWLPTSMLIKVLKKIPMRADTL